MTEPFHSMEMKPADIVIFPLHFSIFNVISHHHSYCFHFLSPHNSPKPSLPVPFHLVHKYLQEHFISVILEIIFVSILFLFRYKISNLLSLPVKILFLEKY